jgi:hypothetical protein
MYQTIKKERINTKTREVHDLLVKTATEVLQLIKKAVRTGVISRKMSFEYIPHAAGMQLIPSAADLRTNMLQPHKSCSRRVRFHNLGTHSI